MNFFVQSLYMAMCKFDSESFMLIVYLLKAPMDVLQRRKCNISRNCTRFNHCAHYNTFCINVGTKVY